MRHWLFAQPVGDSAEAVWMIYSDDAILAEYWEHWMQQGIAHNKANGKDEGSGINPLQCIDDWVTIHWAVPATTSNLLSIITKPKPKLI